MKKFSVFLILIVSIIILSATSVYAAETLIAEGKGGDNVTWKLYDKNSATAKNPYYKLVFSGTGTLRGYTSEGGELAYASRDKSQFAPWRDYIFEAVVEEGITEIGSAGLAFLNNLGVVELPQSVTKLGQAAFETNSSLERIYVAGNNTFLGADLSNITSIGPYAFDGCGSLRYIKLSPNYQGKLQNESFKNCNSVEVFTIPAGVTNLTGTFKYCKNLKAIYFEGDPTMSSTVFASANVSGLTIYTMTDGGNVDTFATEAGITVSHTVPDLKSEFYSDDPSVIDIGKCADDVYYKLVKDVDGFCTMYTFGTGSTMSAVSFSGDGVGYSSIEKVYWYNHRTLIKKVVLSENIKTMSGIACGFMTNLTHLEITENLTGITGACFEASSKFGCIYMRGETPVEGHLDLTNIKRLGSYTFDACRGVKTVEFAEYTSTTYLGAELFKNCTNLHTVKLPLNLKEVRKYTFRNCDSLKNIVFYSDAKINELAFYECSNLESITGLRGSEAQAFAEANGIAFKLPNVLSVYLDGELLDEVDVVDSAYLYPQLIGGKICMLYTDESCTVPFDYSLRIYADANLYAKELVSHAGFMVRVSDYNGLRSIYNLNMEESKGNSLYNIKSMGSISSLERNLRGTTTMTYNDKHIFLNSMITDNTLTGKLTSYPSGSMAQFAHTATGYEENDAVNAKSATEPLYFRCFVVLEDKNTGKTYEIYTDCISATLKDKCEKTMIAGSDLLKEEELNFIKIPANITYNRDALYTKDDLMAYMNAMYDDIDHILYGQHIDISRVDAFADYMANFKDETGDYPAVAGIDQGTINGADLTEEEKAIFRADLVEYAKRGGIISISFHMDNPTDESLYCRGSLGMGEAFDALMTEGTETNDSLMRSLATAAETLQYLEDAGVPVLWRPLHEMNGGWFWWCTVQKGKVLDGEYVARLWRYYYDYLEVQCGLDNLIWVYSPNYTNNTSTTSGTQHVMHCYPGDEYVDIVGCDWYTSTGNYEDIDAEGKSYSSIKATGKPACITEFGPSGKLLPVDDGEHPYKAMTQLQLMKDIAYKLNHSMIYILNWTSNWSIYKMGDSNEFMADPMIYGANEAYFGLIGNNLK